jgi:hypothetical protein
MAIVKDTQQHQEEIDKLVQRVLPRVRAMAFAKNPKHPWLGNPTVDKAVLATIETCFLLGEEDRIAREATASKTSPEPQLNGNPNLATGDISDTINSTGENV